MVYLGFLDPVSYYDFYVTHTHTMVPPNEGSKANLLRAIHEVDEYDPDVDNKILQHLDTYKRISMSVAEEKEVTVRYNTGLEDIRDRDFDTDSPLYDRYHRRWLKCKVCGEICRTEEMAYYGGGGSVNYGVCKECTKQMRN